MEATLVNESSFLPQLCCLLPSCPGVYDKESLKQALISNGFGKDSSKESVLDISPQCPEAKEFLEMLQFNSAVREVFLNRFVQMFSTYDHFIIQPNVQVCYLAYAAIV